MSPASSVDGAGSCRHRRLGHLAMIRGIRRPGQPASVRVHRRAEPDHVAVGIDERALMLTPFGVLREPHIGSGLKPGPGQRVGVLDKQVRRRPAVRSRIEVRLHAEMNLRAIEGDEAVSAAVPLAGTETKPAVVGKGSGQVTNREDGRYSRTHDCNLSRPARAVQASAPPRRDAGTSADEVPEAQELILMRR